MQVLTEIELQVCVCVCVGHCYSLTVSADTTSITLSYPSLFPFPSLLISALIFLKISFFLLCELLVMKVQVWRDWQREVPNFSFSCSRVNQSSLACQLFRVFGRKLLTGICEFKKNGLSQESDQEQLEGLHTHLIKTNRRSTNVRIVCIWISVLTEGECWCDKDWWRQECLKRWKYVSKG